MKHLKHKHVRPLLLLLPGILFCGCAKQAPDLGNELKVLAELQSQEKTAHLQEEPATLVHMLNDSLLEVKNGEARYYTKDEMTDRLMNYFSSVEFIQWEDVKPPVYMLSEDGTMASILITKQIVVRSGEEEGAPRQTSDQAWTELWKKKEGKWKLYMVTTTETVSQ